MSDIDVLRELGVDTSEAERIQKDVEELEGRLATTRKALLALRPDSKDYDAMISKLSVAALAIESQRDALKEELEDVIENLKRKAVHDGAGLAALKAEADKLDQQAIEHLAAAKQAVIARHVITERHNERVDTLAGFAYELGLEAPHKLQTPWRATWASDWRKAVEDFYHRFLACGDLPTEGDLMAWFARRL
ncbi:MAG: hypothetical protein QME21_17460 [Anaerolineales bacterium]|nr:hypothetical protein [Anaerolineales bacterium]